jgi:hypothetical protein
MLLGQTAPQRLWRWLASERAVGHSGGSLPIQNHQYPAPGANKLLLPWISVGEEPHPGFGVWATAWFSAEAAHENAAQRHYDKLLVTVYRSG